MQVQRMSGFQQSRGPSAFPRNFYSDWPFQTQNQLEHLNQVVFEHGLRELFDELRGHTRARRVIKSVARHGGHRR